MSDPEPKYIEVESIKVIHLEPGDLLILEYPGVLSDSAHQRIKHVVSEFAPMLMGRIIILEQGLTAKVLRTGEEDEQHKKENR